MPLHVEQHKVSGANKNSINLMKRVALKDMRDVRELLIENSRKEKTLKRFLEYCYMIDVKVALEGLNGEKTRGLKAAVKYVKEHDIGMTEEQIHAVYCVRYHNFAFTCWNLTNESGYAYIVKCANLLS